MAITLQDQIKTATKEYANEIGGKLGEHGFASRSNILITDEGMRFTFEACINGQWPDDPLPENWGFVKLPER